MKMAKILFFIAGMAPTKEEAEAALEIGFVAMRNRSAIDKDTNPEACDGVAGEVIPEQYKGKPVVKTLAAAVKLMQDKQRVENAAAAAELANTAPAKNVGKEGKAPKEVGTPTPAETGWTANA